MERVTASAPSEDAALVAALRAGDRRAMVALFDRHADSARRLLLHLLGPSPEVPDLLHDIFVIAFERIGELKSPDALGSWIAGISVRTARSFIRRRTRFWLWPSKRPDTVTPAPEPTPDVSAALHLAYTILDRLPTEERIMFALRTIEDRQLDEIAALCGTSIGTVKRRLRRAEERFRRLAGHHSLLHAWLDP